MKAIKVKSSRGDYEILVGGGLLGKAGELLFARGIRGKVLVVTQKRIAKLFLKKVIASFAKKNIVAHVHEIPDGETSKSEKVLFGIYKKLVALDFERHDCIFALGGGVVGDLAGFAAASYLRGIPFVNAGTTLLAQVDSSIGGKTAINLPAGKNLVGAFYPPKLVISDVETLKTLPDRELRASLAEVVKYGVIQDAKLFKLLENKSKAILRKDPVVLEALVKASAGIKAAVVSRDEFETKGERMRLNFGHTFAHGFEQASQYKKIFHGEAVAVGMLCAARLALELKIFSHAEVERLRHVMKNLQLPVSLAGLSMGTNQILKAMGRDKKKRSGRLRFVLPVKIGKVVVREGIALALVRKVISEVALRLNVSGR